MALKSRRGRLCNAVPVSRIRARPELVINTASLLATTPYSHPLCPSRLRGWLRLAAVELRSRLFGRSPEAYHYGKGLAFQEIGVPSRAVEHYSRLLALRDSARVRALLAFNYAALGRFEDSAREYRQVAQQWPDPWILLTLAQAELLIGNTDAAEAIVSRVEASMPDVRLRGALNALERIVPR